MSNLTAHVRRVHKIPGYTAGRTARTVIATSGVSHRRKMVEKAEEETKIFLASLSERRGKTVTIEGEGVEKYFSASPVSFLFNHSPSDLTKEESERRRTAIYDGIDVNIRHPTEDKGNKKHVQLASKKIRVEPPESKSEPQISDDMFKELILRVGSP